MWLMFKDFTTVMLLSPANDCTALHHGMLLIRAVEASAQLHHCFGSASGRLQSIRKSVFLNLLLPGIMLLYLWLNIKQAEW